MLIEGEIKRIKIKKFFTFFSKKKFFWPARWRKFFTPAEMETNNYFILTQHLELASKPEPDLWDTVDRSRKWLVDFNPEKTEIVSLDQSNNSGNFDVKMDGSVLEEKSSFKMLELFFSSKLDCSSYIASIDKTASKKIGALICSLMIHFWSWSTTRPCLEYFCHVWAGAPSCYLDMLDKLQKKICRTVGPSFSASFEPLSHSQNVTSMSFL